MRKPKLEETTKFYARGVSSFFYEKFKEHLKEQYGRVNGILGEKFSDVLEIYISHRKEGKIQIPYRACAENEKRQMITIYGVRRSVIKNFRNYLKEQYGKVNGIAGVEVSNALSYLLEGDKTGYKDHKTQNTSKGFHKLIAILDGLFQDGYERSVPERILRSRIYREIGYQERTIKNAIDVMLYESLITPIATTSDGMRIFHIIPQNSNKEVNRHEHDEIIIAEEKKTLRDMYMSYTPSTYPSHQTIYTRLTRINSKLSYPLTLPQYMKIVTDAKREAIIRRDRINEGFNLSR